MSNSFNISVHPEIAALDAKIDIVDTVVDAIRATDVPALDAKIDTIDTVVDAIKVKTDLLPQNFRGAFNLYHQTTTSGTLVDVCNITGSGVLNQLAFACGNSADTIEVIVTIDGISCTAGSLTHTGDITFHYAYFADVTEPDTYFQLNHDAHPTLYYRQLSIEFHTSLLIQFRRSAGTNSPVKCKVSVCEDS